MTTEKVYIETTSDGIPTLTFAEDKHLSWFRGYRLQVSMTKDGVGDNGSSSTTLRFNLLAADDLALGKEKAEVLRKLVILSHVHEATQGHRDFWKLVSEDDSMLTQLIKETKDEVDNLFPSTEFSIDETLGYVSQVDSVNMDIPHVHIELGRASYDGNPVLKQADFYASELMIAIRMVGDTKWYAIDMQELFTLEIAEEENLYRLYDRFIFVLLCKANISLWGGVGTLTGEPIQSITIKEDTVKDFEGIFSELHFNEFYQNLKGNI